MLERLIADGLAGRFPAEEVDILNWKEMLKRAQDLQALEPARGPQQRSSRHGRGAPGGELGADGSAPQEARGPEAAPHPHARCRDAGPDREGALRGGGAARQQEDRCALERLEKARKELDGPPESSSLR